MNTSAPLRYVPLKQRTLRRLLACCTVICLSQVQASECFNFADTYYQQVYCEIKASGKGNGLPSFLDFRRNTEQMQALLLKPHARKAGVKFELPATTKPVVSVKKTLPAPTLPAGGSDCTVAGLELHCAAASYRLVTNLPNNRLEAGALSAENAMNLPGFSGNRLQAAEVETYLTTAYQHYLQKMMAIGLGGSTMSYGKFAYLFEDLGRKGVSFADRFEVMYRYLKADKRNLSVPVRASLPAGFDTGNCYAIAQWMVCQAGMHNFVFAN